MFLGATGFLGIVSLYRIVWITGRFGGHKTSFAYAITEDYLKRGYRLLTNSSSPWSDPPESVRLDKDGHMKAVVILDEGGLEFKVKSQMEEIASYAAKMDLIFLFPSFWPPTRSARVLTVQPVFSLISAGLPAIIYKWRAKLGDFTRSWVVCLVGSVRNLRCLLPARSWRTYGKNCQITI